jgi:hypothetical protein
VDEWPSVTATVPTPEELQRLMDAAEKAAKARGDGWDAVLNLGRN